MHLKQLSCCSHSDPDEYTESRMRLVEGECLSEKKVIKSYVVSSNCAGHLSYFIPALG